MDAKTTVDAADHALQLADKYGLGALGAVVLVICLISVMWLMFAAFRKFLDRCATAFEEYLKGHTAWNRSIETKVDKLGDKMDSFREEYVAHHSREEVEFTQTRETLNAIHDYVSKRPRSRGSET